MLNLSCSGRGALPWLPWYCSRKGELLWSSPEVAAAMDVPDQNHLLRSGNPEKSIVQQLGHILCLAPGKEPTSQKYLGQALLMCQAKSVGSRLPLSPLFSSLLCGFHEESGLKQNQTSRAGEPRKGVRRPVGAVEWGGWDGETFLAGTFMMGQERPFP